MNMKRITSLLILAVLALVLAGCSGHEDDAAIDPNATAEPTATPDMTDILTASATNAAGAKTPPASSTNAQQTQDAQQGESVPQTTQEAYENALACVGLPVEDLYAAVGRPTGTPTYGPSCLQVDAEDGMLPYDGFSVWTVRSDTAETVHEVYLNEEGATESNNG